MSRPSPRDPYSAPAVLAQLAAERDLERCGLCEKPSHKPLCNRCDAVLTEEQYGDLKTLQRENRKGCSGCGHYRTHSSSCPVVKR